MSGQPATGAHLVGSVPLRDADAVFRAVAAELGDRVKRIPDGETAERTDWTSWQWAVFAASPSLEPVDAAVDGRTGGQFRVRASARGGEIAIGELGYAAAAAAAYTSFAQLKRDGVIPPAVRFQVSLPTPIACINRFILPEDRALVEPAYERAMVDEVRRMARELPHGDIAIQWDVAVQMAFWEQANGRSDFRYNATEPWFSDVKDAIVDRLVRLSEAVPGDIELGLHFCYGNRGGSHFIEPHDTSSVVEIFNRVNARLTRDVAWIHLPVPRDRDDPAYFAPLAGLQRKPGTELYLGLVHDDDGPAGGLRRIEAARTAVAGFGVATECGFGRRDPAAVPALLAVHAALSTPLHDE